MWLFDLHPPTPKGENPGTIYPSKFEICMVRMLLYVYIVLSHIYIYMLHVFY